jgi:transposase InsO family protein
MDFITGLPTTANGFDALLTVTEKFSKAIKLIACKTTTSAEETAKLYIDQAYTAFGLPSKIISDRDPKFTSKFWSTLMTLLDIKLGLTAAYHPQADGQSERTNSIVEIGIRCMLGGDEKRYANWADYLPIFEHEYNSTIHASTGMSPNELRFTCQPRGIADLLYPFEGKSESAEILAESLKNKRDDARDAIRVAQRKQKRLYDKKHSAKEFKVGDLVVLKFTRFGPGYKPPTPHMHKLAPIGTPLRITEKLSPLSYRVALPTGSRIHDVISIIHLRSFKGTAEDVRPLPIEIDGGEEYLVERIDGERLNSVGTKEYLVKWKGYSDLERTWEPPDHLDHAAEILREWHAQHRETMPPSNRRRSPRETRRPPK